MIDRRAVLRGSAVMCAVAAAPAVAAPFNGEPCLHLDIVDENVVWRGAGRRATMRIGQGQFMQPDLALQPASKRLVALLSPANAALLREYVRFERGITLEDRPYPAFASEMGAIRPDARLVMVRWTA